MALTKSTPIVDMQLSPKLSSANLSNMQLLPTPVSPMITNCKFSLGIYHKLKASRGIERTALKKLTLKRWSQSFLEVDISQNLWNTAGFTFSPHFSVEASNIGGCLGLQRSYDIHLIFIPSLYARHFRPGRKTKTSQRTLRFPKKSPHTNRTVSNFA